MIKVCSKCRVPKQLSEFHKQSDKKDGLAHNCKVCRSKAQARRYKQKRDHILTTAAKYRSAHLADHAAREAARRSRKHSTSTSDCLELAMIQEFYNECPPGYHVDHIMPIALGGRHELTNLQWLEASLNLQKSAKHPDTWGDPRVITCKS